jgi:hypothetical protein
MKSLLSFSSSGLVLMALLFPGSDITMQAHRSYKSAKADLAVINVTIVPPHPRARKDMITIRVTVKNIGWAVPSRTCSLGMGVWTVDQSGNIRDGDAIPTAIRQATNNIPQLSPGAQVQISKTITLRHAGRHKVSCTIYTDGLQPDEELANNNFYEKFFMVDFPPKPADLVLFNVSLEPGGRIKLTMYNQGASIPDPDFNASSVEVKVDNNVEKNFHLREIDPRGLLKKGEPAGPRLFTGGRTYVHYVWPASGPEGIALEPGITHSVQVILDYTARISDSNRDNNSKTVSLRYNP